MARNARFWVYLAGRDTWVKFTLRPGQQVELRHFQRCDEGWSRTSERYENDGERVVGESMEEGRDCDGRSEYYNSFHCHYANLRAHEGHDGTPCPKWERGEACQRDEYAELAGY